MATGQLAVAEAKNEVPQLLEKADSAYQDEKYPQVIALYERVLQYEPGSSDIYVNLGTAHYQNGSPGHAALWYRRAEFLNPNVPAVQQNLDVLKQEFGHHDFTSEPWHQWLLTISPSVLSLCAWACLWFSLFVILIVLFVNWQRIKPLLIILLVFSITAATTLFYLQHYRDHHLAPSNFATVVDTRSKAMESPAPDSEPIIDLPEGSEVKILENTGPWLYVMIPGGHIGWVHHSSVEVNWPIQVPE